MRSKKAFRIKPYLYILPSLLLFIVFVFYPFAKTIWLSLNVTNNNGGVISFAGLDNYKTTLTSSTFWFAMRITIRYAAMVVIGSILMGLICGIMANEVFHGRGIVRTVYAMPMAISSACIAVIITFILHPTIGILNKALGTQYRWLRDIKLALPSISAVTIWMNIGMNYIFVIAAIGAIIFAAWEALFISEK